MTRLIKNEIQKSIDNKRLRAMFGNVCYLRIGYKKREARLDFPLYLNLTVKY